MGRFWGVDALASKYFSLSPFAHVANNPLIFIDPDGREIFTSGNSTTYTGADAVNFVASMQAEMGASSLDGKEDNSKNRIIGFSFISYTFNHDCSHTISYHKEISIINEERQTITRVVTIETLFISNKGEFLRMEGNESTATAYIEGKRVISNPLDGIESVSNVYSDFKQISNTDYEINSIEKFDSEVQKIALKIQSKTKYNQKYDYIKKDAARDNFILSVTAGTIMFLAKGSIHPGIKFISGVAIASYAYYNSTRDNRGRTVRTLHRIERSQ